MEDGRTAEDNADRDFNTLKYCLGRANLSTAIKLLRDNPEALRERPLQVALNLLLASILTPFRSYERIRYASAIAGTKLEKDPIFILGHYRSGTTHLHNLLSLDKQLGFMNSIQVSLPELYLSLERTVAPFFNKIAPSKRPCDNMAVEADSPQEDEFAMSLQTRHSFLQVLLFPRNYRNYITKYTLLKGIEPQELEEWRFVYLRMLKKLTLRYGGRQLILKNPEHTSRLPEIISMFPDAKYIYIVRNPYQVYKSSLHLYQSMFKYTSLQRFSDQELRDLVVSRYRQMLEKYIAEYQLIPRGRLVEIRFEDLEEDPVRVIRKIYTTLEIEFAGDYEDRLHTYVDSIENYQKNHYDISDEDISVVNREWGFAFSQWGYEMLNSRNRSSPALHVNWDGVGSS